ncbi:hypothetical protein B0H17DRAFT_1132051 [Mycena rosella]|uniref:Uncharacterized protein n=1 Tax=Mycena rosella TaxID=1033263 RepID=A0AAD7DLZ9_MYCRO|nr:hypothetical protein B0H17DRAFT_1132051 [Mycena rosella]
MSAFASVNLEVKVGSRLAHARAHRANACPRAITRRSPSSAKSKPPHATWLARLPFYSGSISRRRGCVCGHLPKSELLFDQLAADPMDCTSTQWAMSAVYLWFTSLLPWDKMYGRAAVWRAAIWLGRKRRDVGIFRARPVSGGGGDTVGINVAEIPSGHYTVPGKISQLKVGGLDKSIPKN